MTRRVAKSSPAVGVMSMRSRRGLCALLTAACLAMLTPGAHAVTADEVDVAISRMKAYLYRVQNPATGMWETDSEGQQVGGQTALVVFSLLVSGESYQSPAIRKALESLAHTEMEGTYAVALRAAVWAQLPDGFLLERAPEGVREPISVPKSDDEAGNVEADSASVLGDTRGLLERDVRALVRATNDRGQFGYTVRQSQSTNHSTSHFAYLGLWEAAKRDPDLVPRAIWLRAMRYYVESIRMTDDEDIHDGGWGYYARDTPTGSMTAAALTVLLSARQQINPPAIGPPSDVDQAINFGVAWMNRNYEGWRNPGTGTWPGYYQFTLERAALASGVKTFNGREWYDVGVDFFIDHQLGDDAGKEAGGVNVDLVATDLAKPVHTAFALFFLSRGRKPVWISKLEVPGYAWNNRPNDLHFLTRYLSKLSEREYNWQIVNIDTAPEAWMSAPAVYISSDKPLRLTDLQKAQLKRYLDLGGMLICNPQIGSGRFLQSVNDLAEELYPQYAMRKAPGDHWLFRGQFQVDRQSLEVTTLSNGVRDLIVLFNIDWGADWQRNRDHGEDPAWRIGANLWLRLTGRGVLDSRLRQAFPKSDRRAKGKPVRIARASYFGHWDVEPAAWDRMAAVFREHVGRNIEVSSVPLADVTAADFDLVHLAGVSAFTLTADEKWALKRFASDGGTVLVESVGGNNTFALGIEEQIRDLFDRPVVPLSGDDPLITGERIEHGYDLSRVAWRRYTVLNLSVRDTPRIAAIREGGRPAVLFLGEDITLGMMGVTHWGIAGYRPDWARRIATNILLSAGK